MTNEGRTYSFTLQKSPWLINAPPPSPPEPPAYFHRRAPTISFSLFSFHSFRCICTHVRFNRLLYGILKVNRSTMFPSCSRQKKKFPWNFTTLPKVIFLFPLVIWAIGIWLWPRDRQSVNRARFFPPSKNIFSKSVFRQCYQGRPMFR